jgi:hypothetical protein
MNDASIAFLVFAATGGCSFDFQFQKKQPGQGCIMGKSL